jgi:flagellar motility protein MotE (MotC chaperone)
MDSFDRLDDVGKTIGIATAIFGIFSVISTLYDQYCTRRRNRELDERDKKIRDLEERLAVLEAKRKGCYE